MGRDGSLDRSRKRTASGQGIQRSNSTGYSPLGGGSDHVRSLSRPPASFGAGFPMFGSQSSSFSGQNGSRPPFSPGGAFPSHLLQPGLNLRPEDMLAFQQQQLAAQNQIQQQQREQQQQQQSFNLYGLGGQQSSTNLFPQLQFPSSLQTPHQLNPLNTLTHQLQQQTQNQHSPVDRPSSSQSQHDPSYAGNHTRHASQPIGGLYGAGSHLLNNSGMASPVAGTPHFPSNLHNSFTPSGHQQSSRPSSSMSTGRIEVGSAQAYDVMGRLQVCCRLDDHAVSTDPGLLAFCNDVRSSSPLLLVLATHQTCGRSLAL